MTNLVPGLRRALHVLAGRHPTSKDLLAFRDRELDPLGCWSVEVHLRYCKVCQHEAALIEEDLRTFQKMDQLLDGTDRLIVPESLGTLRAAIEDWETWNLPDDKGSDASLSRSDPVLRRVETEFDFYLGNRATAAFLMKMGSGKMNPQGLLAEAESILRDFLGPSAAASITRRILYTQMLADDRVRGSLPS